MRFSTGQLRDFFEDRPSGVKSEHLKGTEKEMDKEGWLEAMECISTKALIH